MSVENIEEKPHSPFRQRRQDISIWPLGRKARNVPPACMSVVLRSAIGRDSELDQFVSGACSLHLGRGCEVPDDADLGEWSSRCGGAESSEGGRQWGATEGEHLNVVKL